MEQVQGIIEQVTNTLTDIAQSDVVVGTPLQLGSVTVVPISRVSAGLGGGGGQGQGDVPRGQTGSRKQSEGTGVGRGGGSGGGA